MTTQFRHILYPTDFEAAEESAFAHALRLAAAAKAELRMLHVRNGHAGEHAGEFPHARPLLERWGMLPAGSAPDALRQLGFEIRKVSKPASDPVRAIVEHARHHETDLVVLSPHPRRGAERWLHPSLSEAVAGQARRAALFVRQGVPGFVSAEDGTARLERVLIPAADRAGARLALEWAAGLAGLLECPQVHFFLLHVGEGDLSAPAPLAPGWSAERISRQGAVVEQILAVAEERAADLVVMATRGHDSLLDALRGSTTERVLREAPCPVLAVPLRDAED